MELLLQMMVCVFALKSQRDRATEHFNIPNNTGETGHLFEDPTSNETACQPRVMHIFPLVFPSNENRQALQGGTLSIKTGRVGETKQTRRTAKSVDAESKQHR